MSAAFFGLLATKTVQTTLGLLAALLPLTSWRFPPDAQIHGTNITVDYIVIGGGTTGSIVASRLTEDPNINVAVIEAGGDPPLESVLPGLFTVVPRTKYDYNYNAVNDYYTSQNVQGHAPGMTAGKMLGGTSGMSHTLLLRGHPHDFEAWAKAAGDDSWNYDGLLPYFKRSERVNDDEILKSSTANLHGTDGNLGVLRQIDPTNDDYIEALKEIGYKYNPDVNSRDILGTSYPYHLIADGVRQDGAESYLGPAKDRENLSVYKQTTVTKILFDNDKNAIGVEAVTGLKTVKFYARKEVLLSAGAVKSPQLLMLSGLGPADHLKKFRIPVISDLPVGKNLKDRVGLLLNYKLQASDAPSPPMNPHKFPVPLTVSYKALDSSQSYPDFQALNLIVPHDSPGLLMICSNVIKYENNICDKIHQSNKGHDLFAVAVSSGHPVSTGEVLLNNKDPMSQPSVKIGLFSNSTDLDNMAAYLMDYSRILNTTHFKSVGAEFVDLGFWQCRSKPKDSLEYWKCYAVAMSSTFWQYCGTNSMGPVVDGRLRVRGVQRLRVVDASAVPSLNSGEILAAVVAFAEKGSDLIKEDMKGLQDL